MEELITKTRIKLQNQSAQSQELLNDLWLKACITGFIGGEIYAKDKVADWITAEQVRDLWEEQK